ncbi:N,N'-diacetylchitobiose transport system substrate-binding protein [Bifidobacterium bohemicum]|uniref:ABC transporter, periplasmic protein n=1 Tax=Bifidobacterium bohemicum DSM 22767 TaxID=1437606 RepID=A0A086ZKB0_9BIFI|nr:sugar ABC transporter substrate-binding protein [Bifidobacterium bohemicum]KFI46960.1 ABC transporter, periplasmic protein [Bifidobacterium bohemicum DSM 22767]SCB86250.1 N,N'-diacetylchitobiose transport system substrate-binding protein [Bifidobacterium bohemicum]
MKKKILASAAVSLSVAMLLGACGGASGSKSVEDAKDQTLTVWAMQGDYTNETLDAINKEFTKRTGAKVKVQTQQWNNITTKVTTALSTATPPDVIDMGNTQVMGFASSGGLMDLTSHASELHGGSKWLSGLEEPATVDGKLYGVPAFGAARAVIYSKKIWKDAGIEKAPTTWDEFTADLDTIATKHASDPDFIPFYLPGQYWYSALQFVWDAGGDLAKKDGDTWKGTTSSEKSIEGLKAWKDFQNKYSNKASQTATEVDPVQDQFLAQGKAAAYLGNSSAIPQIKKIDSSITDDDLGTFALPGRLGKNQPSLVAGSDWAVAVKSQHQDLAVKWLKIASSEEIQQKWVFGHDGWLPNSVQGLDKAMKSSDFKQVNTGFFEAAKISKSTPASPQWATIEGDKSINELVEGIATGNTSVENAAKTFDQHVEQVLNKK